ncbi:phosphoserine phosphatase SerB [Arthrobacter sp. JZ12]|uniref:phosphoserine phosphatase SerB n=1 Tax=Arthrobacter sp. JZ12 TaxID=2654190 RepID=UPI002B49F73D|nr:phosphoserine phosphatase SerB [Arthrobacter sp. JZ12]
MTETFRVVSFGTRLEGSHRSKVRRAVQATGAVVVGESTDDAGAYQVATLTVSSDEGIETLRTALAPLVTEETGVAVVPPALLGEGTKLLIMDVDSTLIKQEVIELLAAHAGREAEVAAVTESAMRGELDFAQSLHARVAVLAGLGEGVIEDVGTRIELSEGAEHLIEAFLEAGHLVAVVSGGFSQILEPLAARLRLSHAKANLLGVDAGSLTGTVIGPVVDRAEKERCLRAWAEAAGIPLERTVAVGDGANDLDMLAAAGLGVAFNSKPAVRAAADVAVDFPYLDVVRHFVRL